MTYNQRITVLIQQFADGSISREDYAELIRHFNLTGNDEQLFTAMDEVWKNTSPSALYTQEQEERFYQQLIGTPAFTKNQHHKKTFGLWSRLTAAAVVLVAVSAGIYFYKIADQPGNPNRFVKNDLAPGGNKATLTLADGSVINLNDAAQGDLASQGGIAITKTKDGQLVYSVKGADAVNPAQAMLLNTIATPRGGQYQVNLPDGSKVWLNTSSSLKFPVQFSKNERRVVLSGEAYFEVAKNKMKPFVVKTAAEEVEVLGTHFNINAYPDESNQKTTLMEGSVSISFTNPAIKGALLKPGQQAQLNGSAQLKVLDVDTEQAMAWKNGLFMFDGQDLEGIMKQVSRWYDVDVVFENDEVKKKTFKGTISRFNHISQLLQVLESTGSVEFKMEGRRITAM
ncbi:putative anti-sigma factor [Pedobacter sp. BAL39]|uniref:FecR family protein n=1 Tax=Pedobacter sp. BAL39 TaxID=391596 RepID=UPI000155A137|nr:FecR family protein [Pedobacter sp. BAL39]EDM36015.1 putative anti-sigma factor [Pedobacter sp. BAL39]